MYLLPLLNAIVLRWARVRRERHLLHLLLAFAVLQCGIEIKGIVPLVERDSDEHVRPVGVLDAQNEVSTRVGAPLDRALRHGADGEDAALLLVDQEDRRRVAPLDDLDGALPHLVPPVGPAVSDGRGLPRWELEHVRILEAHPDPLNDGRVLERPQEDGCVARPFGGREGRSGA